MPRRLKSKEQQQSTLSSLPRGRKGSTRLDVAREYAVSLRTVDQWVHDRKIPFQKLGPRLVRFDMDKVAQALERYTIKEVK
jgi:excisionase family DNA binding protein